MTNETNKHTPPVRVTGEERRHPSIRKIARACIAIARLQLAKPQATNSTATAAGAAAEAANGGQDD